jgi:hypothetical protein
MIILSWPLPGRAEEKSLKPSVRIRDHSETLICANLFVSTHYRVFRTQTDWMCRELRTFY